VPTIMLEIDKPMSELTYQDTRKQGIEENTTISVSFGNVFASRSDCYSRHELCTDSKSQIGLIELLG
jgi:hypothetical protein